MANIPGFLFVLQGTKSFVQLAVVVNNWVFLRFSKHPKTIFTEEGYGNWSMALQGFQDDEKSDIHKLQLFSV